MNRDIFFIRLIGMLDENAIACDSLPIRIKINMNGQKTLYFIFYFVIIMDREVYFYVKELILLTLSQVIFRERFQYSFHVEVLLFFSYNIFFGVRCMNGMKLKTLICWSRRILFFYQIKVSLQNFALYFWEHAV